MSVVAAKVTKDRIIIGSDSIRTNGYGNQEKLEFAKLRRMNGIILGSCGAAYESSLFFLFCKSHKPSSEREEDILEFLSMFQEWVRKKTGSQTFNMTNEYILIYEKKVYKIHNFLIQTVKEYAAIGAGMDFALSALYLGRSVKKAIEAACELSIYCEKPINIFEVEL